MRPFRDLRWIVLALALGMLPSLAPAEVSVELDEQGQFKNLVIRPELRGRSADFWRQVRPNLAPRQLLNPLGSSRGDGRPVIGLDPVTRAPWVFWPMNVANQKRLAFSYWSGKAWTEPSLVVADAGAYYYDQLDPAVAFGSDGAPYLVWRSPEQEGSRVYFSTLIGGRFSPPMLMSEEKEDARRPSIVVQGLTATILYRTSAGLVRKVYEMAVLEQSAASLMDTPLPPGHDDGNQDGQGGGGGSGDNKKMKH
jgi:hypothetical protein